MSERIGLLFTDGSLFVLPDGGDPDAARREAEEADWGEPEPRTQVVRLRVTLALAEEVAAAPGTRGIDPL